MIFNSYRHWRSYIQDYQCEECGNKVPQKYEIISASKYLMLQFMIFNNSLYKLDFSLSSVPQTKLTISGSIYSIFNQGMNIHHGHNNEYVRNISKWMCVNDKTVSEESWPVNDKNLYALIMKK